MRNNNILFITILILALSSAVGFCYHRVDDFRVNDSIPPSDLEHIYMATDYKGKFVVAWSDIAVFGKYETYLKQFRSNGSIVGGQFKAPDIIEQGQRLNVEIGFPALQPNGNIVLVRGMEKDSTDSLGNPVSFVRGYIDIFDSLGNPLVPSYLADMVALHYIGLKADKDGNFTVLLYKSSGGPGSEIYFKQFYANGDQRGNLTKVESDSLPQYDFGQQNQSLAMNKDGRFMITWDASQSQLPMAAIYYLDGTTVRQPFLLSCEDSLVPPSCVLPGVNCYSASGPKAGIDSVGNFMAAYNVCTEDLTGKHVYARAYDSLGIPLTPNMDIQEMENTYVIFHRPRVAATEDGGYVVVWVDKDLEVPDKPGADIWVKRFNANGEQVGVKYRINNLVGSVVAVENLDATVSNGHLFVAWYDKRDRPSLIRSVYAQIMPVNEVGVFTPGDINYDYNINISDLIGMVNYVFKGADPPEGSPLVCDVNGNCKVDIVDIIYLVNHLFKGGSPPVGCSI